MSAAMIMERIAEASPRVKARIAGVFYLLTFLTGGMALFVRGGLGFAAGLIAGACYIAVTLLFYYMSKPGHRSLSLLVLQPRGMRHWASWPICSSLPHQPPGTFRILLPPDRLPIFKSTFLPRILGVLMAIAGLGWLTFLSTPLAHYLSPYKLAPGILGEGALTLWLLVVGVNEERWNEQASAAGEWQS